MNEEECEGHLFFCANRTIQLNYLSVLYIFLRFCSLINRPFWTFWIVLQPTFRLHAGYVATWQSHCHSLRFTFRETGTEHFTNKSKWKVLSSYTRSTMYYICLYYIESSVSLSLTQTSVSDFQHFRFHHTKSMENKYLKNMKTTFDPPSTRNTDVFVTVDTKVSISMHSAVGTDALNFYYP